MEEATSTEAVPGKKRILLVYLLLFLMGFMSFWSYYRGYSYRMPNSTLIRIGVTDSLCLAGFPLVILALKLFINLFFTWPAQLCKPPIPENAREMTKNLFPSFRKACFWSGRLSWLPIGLLWLGLWMFLFHKPLTPFSRSVMESLWSGVSIPIIFFMTAKSMAENKLMMRLVRVITISYPAGCLASTISGFLFVAH